MHITSALMLQWKPTGLGPHPLQCHRLVTNSYPDAVTRRGDASVIHRFSSSVVDSCFLFYAAAVDTVDGKTR